MNDNNFQVLTCREMGKKYNYHFFERDKHPKQDTREYYTDHFGFVGLTTEFVQNLTNFLKNSRVLGIMSGTGYLERCLKDNGVNIIATDSKEWANNGYHNGWKKEFIDVENLDALLAIDKYKDWADYVIMSWPPYEEPIACEVAKKLQTLGITLIYIGEDWGGCTADDDFFEFIGDYESDLDTLRDGFFQFFGIHDCPYIINWTESSRNSN